jgi:hypothetical protein
MTKRQWVGLLSALAAAGAAVAQTPAPAERSGAFTIAVPAPPGGQDVMMYQSGVEGALSANTAFIASEFSFEGSVVKNAPYSAQAVTETTQRLADGNRISHKTTATLYRDSEGRTRREETISAIGPWASNAEPFQTIFINDPVSKTNLVLNSQNKTVEKMTSPQVRTVGASAGMMGAIGVTGGMVQARPANRVTTLTGPGEPATFAVSGFSPGSMVSPDSNTKTEQLGAQTIEGVRAEGARTTVTLPAGSIGNDLPIDIVSERWYSPELQTVVMTKRNDPRMGETVYRLTNVIRSEPARSLFEAPADYTVVDEQQLKRNAEDQFKEKVLREKSKE